MLYMKSTSGADGSYKLTVTFALGTDPDINTVNVQNRVSLAEPQLPEEVTRQGLTTKKVSSALLQVIQLYSPNGTYDALFLTNYGAINILDALKRIRGVGDASLFGSLNYSMRIWLDPNELTSFDLTPTDVAAAIQQPEHPGRGRPDRRSAARARSAVPAHDHDPGPTDRGRPVREHHHARQSRRLDRARQGRGAGRARRPGLRRRRRFTTARRARRSGSIRPRARTRWR